jgi:hypothetical protein
MDVDTSLPGPTTTGVPTGGLGDLIGVEKTADEEDLGASSIDLLQDACKTTNSQV